MKSFKTAFITAIGMFLLCGLVFPLVLTGLAQIIFPDQANGSLITINDKVVGAKNVGQNFTDPRLFHSRPSAYNYNTYTDPAEFAGLGSGSQNMAPSNPALKERINADIAAFLAENPTVAREDIPDDLITASGSGLDPHITVQGALVQVDRIVANTGLTKERLEEMIREHTDTKLFGIFGEERVNVLELNLALWQEIGESI